MRKRTTAAWTAVLFSVLGACSSAPRTATPPVTRTHTVTPVSVGDAFYAVAPSSHSAVVEISARSGKTVRQVIAGSRNGLTVSGLARLSAGALLVTYTTGPECTSNVSGCGPKPDTCGAEVDSVNIASGAVAVLWRLGRDERLSDARPSPDGTKVAALTSPCVPSYFNSHLVIRRLSDGTTWRIGDRVARCHVLGAPQWTADSAHLLVTYGPPMGAQPARGSDGVCGQFGDSNLVEVPANGAQPLIDGVISRVPTGCTYQATAVSDNDAYVIQACGPDTTRLHGPATLVRLNQSLQATARWPVGDCTDGNSLAADPAKGVLVSAYLYCNPPLAGEKPGQPTTVLDRLKGGSLQRVTAAAGGETAVQYLTW